MGSLALTRYQSLNTWDISLVLILQSRWWFGRGLMVPGNPPLLELGIWPWTTWRPVIVLVLFAALLLFITLESLALDFTVRDAWRWRGKCGPPVPHYSKMTPCANRLPPSETTSR